MSTPWEIERIRNVKDQKSTRLDLSGAEQSNKLYRIDNSIFELHQLTWLNLSHNKLYALHRDFTNLQNLTELYLHDNLFTAFPDSVMQLPQLRKLIIRGNGISSLPSEISKLKSLTQLDLHNNRLTIIPDSIAQLSNLQILDLSNNQIESLPDTIALLQNLTALDLRNNKIKVLPESITKLDNLKELLLGENPLTSPPPEVAKKGIEAIREYFRQLREGQDYLYEAKLLILGEGGAGKTTLANKIINSSYQLTDERSTEGIDVIRWTFPIEGGKEFRVNIWDFGGQEIYHTTHQFFLTKRSLYALVVDTRKDDTDFYYWLNVVELLSNNSPLLIIKNEKQDRHREINERQLRGQFDNLKEVLATNLSNNRGLDAVKDELKHYIKNLSHIGSLLPKTWVRVRETLENDKRNFISLSEYLKICSHNGFTDIKDSLQLSGYLHDIGVFLHFQEDPILKNTVILKPKWGTDAVYNVLDNKSVIHNLGQFTRGELENIWNAIDFANMYDELLQLMMKFKLCYEIPDMSGTYIAPQLLTENEPYYAWDENENLYLRYDYEFMPKGILTQFIVIMHQYIWRQQFVWKSGVVLEKDKTYAEVVEYYGKREIHIRVRGAHKTQLMAIVMHELDKIHVNYRRLRYSKLIPCNCIDCRKRRDPHFYLYEQLQNFLEKREKRFHQIQCGTSGNMVNVRSLIEDVFGKEYQPAKTDENNSINKFEIKVEAGANVGNIVLGSSIQDSFNKVISADISNDLRNSLEGLVRAVNSMSTQLPKEQAEEVAKDLDILIEESTKSAPREKWYQLSAEGLIQAAENVGKIGIPVIELAGKVVNLLMAIS